MKTKAIHCLWLNVFLLSLLLCPMPCGAELVDADILLQGGTIFDGSGNPPNTGDVAIRGDQIVGVGSFKQGKIGQVIDCSGLAIAPGFIDLHNHSDAAILKPKTRAALNYLTQGCTTLVTGNCGGGNRRVADYYKKLDEQGCGVNIAHLLPHGAIRNQVIGKNRNAPTPKQLRRMCDLADKAMSQGAWGMSTGLEYVPGTYAELDELVAIAKRVAQHGGIYASHMRNEGDQLIDSIEETIEVGRQAGVHAHVSHFKASGRRNWGKVRVAAELINAARKEGIQVTADQYPYIASNMRMLPLLLSEAEREGGEKATIVRLNNPEQLPKLRQSIAESLQLYDRLMVANCKGHPEWVGKMIHKIAADEQRDQVDVALDILRVGGAKAVNFCMDENDIRFVMTLPWVATASDGSIKLRNRARPHPRSYGTFPRKIGRYAARQQDVSLEMAVRSATGLPADILKMTDRGYLRPGYLADVVVFDPDSFIDKATYDKPYKHSAGVLWVYVNGQVVLSDGKPNKVLAGRALRKNNVSSLP